uniref:NADH dehydrogenase subunit 5 n=1 Tax=Platystethus dilutipennis TaxID=3078934 RepID=UPI002A7FE0C1|nr:NADH dehydrogenase subunit 5 [Platystethus dilutipennis]WON66102.1 NADH dehydrogenase subunit 5 [Platystethus dilutipennis]
MISICIIYFFMFIFCSVILFISSLLFLMKDYCYFLELEMLSLNYTSFEMVLLFDWMSFLFMSFVLFISSMVMYYSKEYMLGDMNLSRFILIIFMFVMSMMLLIISPNLVSILLGWDGLGLVSYCLVIYYQNIKSANAGMITAMTNRIGDVMLLMSISWMLNYGSWNFMFYLEFMKNDIFMNIISLMVVLAAMTKSAQIPFSSWLPAAMAAPTPVSSLVHSSTLVTAGVYLLIRFYNCLNSMLLLLLLFIGIMTMFMAGLGANYEFDLKKIIALSTLSQLGLMISILSMGDINLSFYHLLTHALFKATLFMCAGNMIHSLMNCQDIRYMGNMIIQLPITCVIFNISNLSLCGFPFLAGFYSKDLILEFISMNYINIYVYVLFYLSTGLTMMYTIRLMYYSMIGGFNFLSLNMLLESSFIMLKSMMMLVLMINIGGSMLMWLIIQEPYFICLPFVMKFMTLLVILVGLFIGYELSKMSLNYDIKSLKMLNSSLFFSNMWNMPMLSVYMNKYFLGVGMKFYKNLDQGWFEYLGSQNLFNKFKFYSIYYQFLFSNNLKIYLVLIIVWMIILLLLLY